MPKQDSMTIKTKFEKMQEDIEQPFEEDQQYEL